MNESQHESQNDHRASFGDWLTVAIPRLSPHLASPASVAPAARVAAHLPEDCLGVLEFRLGAGGRDAPVDLSIQLAEPRHAQEVLARLPTPRLRACLAPWAAGDPASAGIPSFWLEYDADGVGDVDPATGAIPEPMLLVRLSSSVHPRWFLDQYLPLFLGAALPARQTARAVRAMQQLPSELRPLYLFGLRSRGSDAIRIDTLGPSVAGVVPFLRSVISEEVAGRAEAAAALLADAERIHFSFEVTPDGFGTRVGIEGSFLAQPAREPRWQTLLDRLVAGELCTPAQRDAILGWPGYDTARTIASWPGDRAGQPRSGVCTYGVSHIKLATSPERPLQAKVYLTAKLVRRGDRGDRALRE